jgi:hypothetical protein
VFGVPAGKLKDYSTSKKDMKRGVEIVPEETYRLRDEDIYTPKKDFQDQRGDSVSSSDPSYGMKGAGSTTASTASSSSSGFGDQFGEDYDPKSGFRDASRTLYAKTGYSRVTL